MDVQRPEPAAVSVDEVIDVIDEEDEATNTSDIGAAPAIPAADNTLRYQPPGTFYKARGKLRPDQRTCWRSRTQVIWL